MEYETFTDPLLIDIQKRWTFIQRDFPADKKGWYCNLEGLNAILEFARELRSDGEQSKKELT